MRFKKDGPVSIAAPASPAARVEDLRELLRIDTGEYADQDILERLLNSASDYAVQYLRSSLILQEWRLILTTLHAPYGLARETQEDKPIMLAMGPVVVVDRVYQEDEDGDEWPISYSVNLKRDPATVRIKDTTDKTIIIEYTAGYGESVNAVPNAIQQGILQLAGYLYENRYCDIGDAAEKSGAKAIWKPFRRELI